MFKNRNNIFCIINLLYLNSNNNFSSEKKHKKFEYVIEKVDKEYFDSYEIFLAFLEQIEKFSKNNNKSLLKFPEDSKIEKPKFGNSLLYLTKKYKNLNVAI